jgi:hypothetical protein
MGHKGMGRPRNLEWLVGYVILPFHSGVAQAAVLTRIRGVKVDRYWLRTWFLSPRTHTWLPARFQILNFSVDTFAKLARMIIDDRKGRPSEDNRDLAFAKMSLAGKWPPPGVKYEWAPSWHTKESNKRLTEAPKAMPEIARAEADLDARRKLYDAMQAQRRKRRPRVRGRVPRAAEILYGQRFQPEAVVVADTEWAPDERKEAEVIEDGVEE